MDLRGNVSFVADSFLACMAFAAADAPVGLANKASENRSNSPKQNRFKARKNHLSFAFVALAALGCGLGASVAHGAPFPSLGQAGGFAILDINGGTLDINNADTITTNPGNLGIGPNVSGTTQKATITGNVVVDPTATYNPTSDFHVTGTTTVASLAQAQTDANNASTAFDALTPTVTLTGDQTNNLVFTGNGGINVIDINGDLDYNGNTLTLHGGANDIFVFNVTGTLSWAQSQFVLDSNVSAGHIIVNLVGGDTSALNRINKSASVWDGTLLAPDRSVRQDNPATTFDGAIIAEDIQIDSSAVITGTPFTGSPVPEPASLGLLSIGGLALLMRRRRSA